MAEKLFQKAYPFTFKVFANLTKWYCSAQLNMTFFLLINVKMPTTVGNLTFVNRTNSILGLSELEKLNILIFFLHMNI